MLRLSLENMQQDGETSDTFNANCARSMDSSSSNGSQIDGVSTYDRTKMNYPNLLGYPDGKRSQTTAMTCAYCHNCNMKFFVDLSPTLDGFFCSKDCSACFNMKGRRIPINGHPLYASGSDEKLTDSDISDNTC